MRTPVLLQEEQSQRIVTLEDLRERLCALVSDAARAAHTTRSCFACTTGRLHYKHLQLPVQQARTWTRAESRVQMDAFAHREGSSIARAGGRPTLRQRQAKKGNQWKVEQMEANRKLMGSDRQQERN
eukprot:2848936-Pleurochrysis_carterae.AAC.4